MRAIALDAKPSVWRGWVQTLVGVVRKFQRYLLEFLLVFIATITLGPMVFAIVTYQPFVRAIDVDSARFSKPMNLQRSVIDLAENLPARDDDPDNANRVSEYIFQEFSKYGTPDYQNYDVSGLNYRNVILKFDSKSNRNVVIGAHYDSYNGLPGADDNASGVAGLIELARLISESRPGIDVELVAYALEEPPYFRTHDMGSFHHAEVASRRADLPYIVINLEMIGYFSDEPGSQRYPIPALKWLYGDTGDFVAIVGRTKEIPLVRKIRGVFLGNVGIEAKSLTLPPIIPGVGLSDHRNYWARDIKSIMITDTAFMRNRNYHQPTDTPETLDYRRMARVVDGVYFSLFALSKDDD